MEIQTVAAAKITAQQIIDAITTAQANAEADAMQIKAMLEDSHESTRAQFEQVAKRDGAERATYRAELIAMRETVAGLRAQVEDLITEQRAAAGAAMILAGRPQAAAAEAALANVPETKTCTIHSAEMQRHEDSETGEHWYSHKTKRQDGSAYYCKGKTHKNVDARRK